MKTVIVSVYLVTLGINLALANSMPTWKVGAHNYFYMILKVGTILAYYPCQEFDSLKCQKSAAVNNLTECKLGTIIAYFLYVIFYQVVKKSYQVVKKWHDKCKC